MKSAFALAVVLTLTAAGAAPAQEEVSARYPNIDRPLVLAHGDTVRLLNRILVDRAPGQRGARVDVSFSTSIPAANGAARGAQADRVAQIIGAQVFKRGIRRLTVGICDTRACAETREPPGTWYVYERGLDGVWLRDR